MSGADDGTAGPRRELPVDRRVTPDALESFYAPRPSTGFSAAALVRGATVAWLSFPFVLLVPIWIDELRQGGTSGIPVLVQALFVLGFSFLVVACVGLPIGVLVALRLRSVAQQGWHVAAFAGAGAVVAMVVSALLGGFPGSWLVPGTAAAAALGRASMWRRFEPQGARD